MNDAPANLRHLARESLLSIRELVRCSRRVRGWQLLQERDPTGKVRGCLPYTDQAIEELSAAHGVSPDDSGLIHHLAVAHHARAWDLELRGDPRAAREWERALGYWRALSTSGDFWSRMQEKLRLLDPTADPAVLSRARSSLLEDLLDVHVDFIRHYWDMERPDRAVVHVEIVRRAAIAPAVKKRLTGRIFDDVCSALAGARASRALEAALVPLERFLHVFPEHLPALRLHAELAKAWVETLSYQDHWPAIAAFGSRCRAPAQALACHPELSQQPLAKVALAALAGEFAVRALHRGSQCLAELDDGTTQDPTPAAEALDVAVDWAHLAAEHASRESLVHGMLPNCLNEHSRALRRKALVELRGNNFVAALALLERGIAQIERAIKLEPDDPAMTNNLDIYRSDVQELRLRQSIELLGKAVEEEGEEP